MTGNKRKILESVVAMVVLYLCWGIYLARERHASLTAILRYLGTVSLLFYAIPLALLITAFAIWYFLRKRRGQSPK
jgi:hypothetical protein